MPVTDPVTPVFPAGYGPFPADFTTWVTNPMTFLAMKVMFRAQLQGGQSLIAGENILAYDTILEDPYGGWSAAATGSQAANSWLAPPGCSGWYEVTLNSWMGNAGNNTTSLESALFLDGSIYQEMSSDWAVNGHATGTCASVPVPLLGGIDYIQGSAAPSTASSTPTTNGQYCSIEVVWISL
jgi:hypothetical protein